MKEKILKIAAIGILVVMIGLSLFGMIYYNNHYTIAGWVHYALTMLVCASIALIWVVRAINKELDEGYFESFPHLAINVPLIAIGVALIIAGAVCTVLVSQLFWIMAGIGGLVLTVGVAFLCWDKITGYLFAITTGISMCAFAMCFAFFVYDCFPSATWQGTLTYGDEWLYKEYNEAAPENLRGGIGLYGYNGRTAENVKMPSEINDKTVLGVVRCSFRKESCLKSVTIPDTIQIMYNDAFEYCTSLTSVHYDGSIDEWCAIEFENERANPLYYAGNLYAENERVIDIEISDSVAKVGAYAFYNCKYVKSLTIPATVTEIGDSAFYGCEALTRINFGGTKAQWNEIEKGDSWSYLTGFYTVTCLDGELNK